MKAKSNNSIIGVALLLSFMLFSSLECNNEYPEEWECSQAAVDARTRNTLNEIWLFELDPPKLIYNMGGPSDICTRKNIEVVAGLLCKLDPPYTISAICFVGEQFYNNRIVLTNYDTSEYIYSSEVKRIKLYSNGSNLATEVGCKFEVTWTPTTPYNTEQELKAFVNKYLDEVYVQYNYYLFKP